MPSTKMLFTIALFTVAYALPTPQGAGTGAAANSILSSTDNGVGFGVENAEDNTAALITSTKGSVPHTRRQGAGTGAAANSILSSTDNGVGFGVENAEDNTAALITSTKGSVPARRSRRQLDKVSNGAQAVSNAVGTGAATASTTGELDTVDGQTTGGQANLGAQVGNTEASTLEAAGSAIPKRQLDKIAKGAQAVSDAAGTGAATSSTTNGLVSIDGTTTGGQAAVGAAVGDTEAGTLEAAGSSVPTSA